MNFISEIEGQEILVELKYCERCGGLWLRPQGTDGIYCATCRVLLAAMPDPGQAPPRQSRRRRRQARAQEPETAGTQGAETEAQVQAQGEELPNAARIDDLQGVAAMEVRA